MGKTILVFDDDKAILDIFTIVLESSGYTVEVSETSHDIISKVESANPDVIIMDNWIPNIGGIEATRLIKKHKDYFQIPVILCSANSDIAVLTEKAGADGFLPKPFDLLDLEMTVANMFNRAKVV